MPFRAPDGRHVPSVSAEEMREVDRIAVEEVGLDLLVMMEGAGRGLATVVQRTIPEGPVAVLAGAGGNGGGGLCAARHLANRDREVWVVLDREAVGLEGAAARQWRVLGDDAVDRSAEAGAAVERASVIVDALVGYGLAGPPRGRVAKLVDHANEGAGVVVSLDVPTGIDATTGRRPGGAVEPDRTVTLALPKPGLEAVGGELVLADLGIPARVFERAGVIYEPPFRGEDWLLDLEVTGGG